MTAPDPMTIEEAQAFIESVPWRAVQQRPEGPANKPPEPHEYVILEWREVPTESFWAFVNLVRANGYRGRYTAPYNGRSMVNRYLVIGDYVFWAIHPNQLCRTRVEDRQHEPLPEQTSMEVGS